MTISAKAQLGLRANVTITARDARGRYTARRKVKNLVVLTGRNLVASLLAGNVYAAPTHIALGTGILAVTDSDTALQSEQYRDLITRRRPFSSREQFQLYLDTTQGNGISYTEAGIFNVVNGVSTLFARITFTAIPKDGSSNLTISWDIYIASS